MTQDQRQLFSDVYLSHPERFASFFRDPNIDLAQEGGYYSKLGTNSYYDPTPLDSLLGMEGNDVRKMEKIPGTTNLKVNVDNGLLNLSETQNLLETQAFNTPIPFTLEQFVFLISP
jgi:hypothetical protein